MRQLLKFKHHQGLCCRSLLHLKKAKVPKSTEPVEEAIGAVKKAVKITAGLQ